MCTSVESVRSLDDLRGYVHRKLCEKENLLADQFRLAETQLTRQGRPCGLQFLLYGPRDVKLNAIWATDRNRLYFYDTRGVRYEKVHLPNRIEGPRPPAGASAGGQSS